MSVHFEFWTLLSICTEIWTILNYIFCFCKSFIWGQVSQLYLWIWRNKTNSQSLITACLQWSTEGLLKVISFEYRKPGTNLPKIKTVVKFYSNFVILAVVLSFHLWLIIRIISENIKMVKNDDLHFWGKVRIWGILN